MSAIDPSSINPYLPSATWVLPMLTAFASFPFGKGRERGVRIVNLIGSLLNLGLVLYLLRAFLAAGAGATLSAAGTQTALVFPLDMPWLSVLNIHYTTGLDGLSILMMLLSDVLLVNTQRSITRF